MESPDEVLQVEEIDAGGESSRPFTEEPEATGTHAVHARVVDDGDFISAGGVTSGLDLALYLLERELGPRIALAVAVEQLFAYERRGTVWRAVGPTAAAF